MAQARQRLRLYTPHAGQLEVERSIARFNVVCWGRQSGKTTFGLNKLLRRAWQGPKDGIYWYILQTYDAARVAFNRIMRFYMKCPSAFAKKPNESQLQVVLRHGPTIEFKSGKNYQDLRVETLNGCVIDEYRQQPRELWPQVIRPMLTKKNGWADILSTANGFDHFYDMFESAASDSEWARFHSPSTIAPWWTQEEIDSAKRTMSESVFAQEIMAEFRDLVAGKAYLNHGVWNQVTSSPFTKDGLISPHLPIIVAMDFNLSPMAWTLGQERLGDWYFFDSLFLHGSHTQEAARALVDKVKGHTPGVVLIGDATARAGQRAAAGQSDYAIVCQVLTDHGIKWVNETPESNPPVKDRVNTVNAKLKAADGSVHLFYNPERCPSLKKDFDRVVWKSSLNGDSISLDQHKDTDLTHSSDGVGYAIYARSEMWKPSPGLLRVVTR